IQDLRALVARTMAAEPMADGLADQLSEARSLRALVGDLERRLGRECARREKAEAARAETLRELQAEQERRRSGEGRVHALRAEIDAVETRLQHDTDPATTHEADACDLGGRTLLYVGGRPEQLPRMRSLAGR